MKTLDRYLIGSFLINYLLSLFVLISLYVVLDLFVNLDRFTEKGYPAVRVLANIADYYFFNLPLYFSQLSGVISAFAACATVARLQRQNEITAILSSGTSLYRVAAPVLAVALATNVLLVLNYEIVLPGIAPKLARTRNDVEGERVYSVWFVRDGESRLLSAQQFSPKLQAIRNFIVQELSTDPATRGQLTAVVKADKARWDSEIGQWRLIPHGVRIPAISDEGNGPFGQAVMERERLDVYPCSLTPEELRLRQNAQWLGFLSTRQLNLLAQRGDVRPERIAQVKNARFTQPIGNMILLIIGLSFFLHRLPDSVLSQGAKALGACTVVFLITMAGQQMIGMLDVNPALPAWLPIFIFGPVAVLLLDNIKT